MAGRIVPAFKMPAARDARWNDERPGRWRTTRSPRAPGLRQRARGGPMHAESYRPVLVFRRNPGNWRNHGGFVHATGLTCGSARDTRPGRDPGYAIGDVGTPLPPPDRPAISSGSVGA